jgi:hypothetical protein
MYKTRKITVNELMNRMRHMEVGEEIGLCHTPEGEYSYGIRRLPDTMFDNGMCWLADYYGGGATAAFSETEEGFLDRPDKLQDAVEDWLVQTRLLFAEDEGDYDPEYVYMQVKDGSLPETKWEFKETEIVPQNKMVCVDFTLTHAYRTYVSVPKDATEQEITETVTGALMDCDRDTFLGSVIDCEADHWDIWPEDFVDVSIDHCSAKPTSLPVGTISQ